ncbi:hypothetical protein B7463_g12387, partial [Scytalidium lignicola]
MAALPMPYQCLQTCGNILVAARGANIDAFNLENGTLLSTWSSQIPQDASSSASRYRATTVMSSKDEVRETSVNDLESSSPQAKRRRLSNPKVENEDSQEKYESKSTGVTTSPALSKPGGPTIITMAATSNGEHLVATTGEEKSIRVFEWESIDNSRYSLNEISRRVMPKRPCAIAITKDDSIIISADKFGDVYALPLIETKTPSDEPKDKTENLNSIKKSSLTPKSKPFKPAASDLTVHSVRNLKALQNQLRHSDHVTEKSGPDFEHQVLLGHVSMLTDLTLVTLNGRDYIITADRDEHIRISRGLPQSHVIESFCLGHNEFVSRLCVPKTRPDILISGGGENALFVWDWRVGGLIFRENLSVYTDTLLDLDTIPEDTATSNDIWRPSRMIAVSNIYHAQQTLDNSTRDVIIVTCEGVPALLIFVLTDKNHLEHLQTLNLVGNALSVAVNASSAERLSVIVSIDVVHSPGSTTKLREKNDTVNPLQCFTYMGGGWNNGLMFQIVEGYETELEDQGGNGRFKEMLYSLESLRKREGGIQADE